MFHSRTRGSSLVARLFVLYMLESFMSTNSHPLQPCFPSIPLLMAGQLLRMAQSLENLCGCGAWEEAPPSGFRLAQLQPLWPLGE